MLVYATTEDLVTWTGAAAPVNAPALLRAASVQVRRATSLVFYATDDDGMPTDPDVLQAFNDATCCHAAALAALDIDPATGGVILPGTETSVGIGTAKVQFADAAAAAQQRIAAATSLVPDAAQILADSGLRLTLTAPWVIG